jgi:hypothetical protein
MAKKAIALLFGMCCLAVTAFSETAEPRVPGVCGTELRKLEEITKGEL